MVNETENANDDPVLGKYLTDVLNYMVKNNIDSVSVKCGNGLKMKVELDYREVIKNMEHQLLYGDKR